ncbi:unnamed protein product [Clonostachys rosea]|uniref:Uncharacterized protein n=1 Tax=Bionectria ochroleuca TaxID=29856 RepID=A0ABY6UV07_BIOOC|nr:unnamed protein product [Clonostachys rosea]
MLFMGRKILSRIYNEVITAISSESLRTTLQTHLHPFSQPELFCLAIRIYAADPILQPPVAVRGHQLSFRLVRPPIQMACLGRVRMRLGQIARPADKVLLRDVRPAEPSTAAARGVKRFAAMQHAHVVEEDGLSRLHLGLVHGGLLVDEALEDLRALDPGVQVLDSAERLLERRAPVDAAIQVARDRVPIQDISAAHVPVAVLLVAVQDMNLVEGLDGRLVAERPHHAANAVRVAKQRLTTAAGVIHAVQDLDFRGWLEIEEVLVQAEVAARVGDVLCVGLGSDVKGAAVEGLADVGHAGRDLHDGVFVAGHVLEEDDAQAHEILHGIPEGVLVLHVVVVIDLAHSSGDDISVPVFNADATLKLRHSGLDGLRARREVFANPVPSEGDFMVVFGTVGEIPKSSDDNTDACLLDILHFEPGRHL